MGTSEAPRKPLPEALPSGLSRACPRSNARVAVLRDLTSTKTNPSPSDSTLTGSVSVASEVGSHTFPVP